MRSQKWGVTDGQQVDIPVSLRVRHHLGKDRKGRQSAPMKLESWK